MVDIKIAAFRSLLDILKKLFDEKKIDLKLLFEILNLMCEIIA